MQPPSRVALPLLLFLPLHQAQDIVRRSSVEYRPIRPREHAGAGGASAPAGLGLSLLSAALLWWNEGRALRESTLLRAVLRQVHHLDGEKELDPALDDTLIHVSGRLESGGVQDVDFSAVQRQSALRLRRTTEVYQWREERHESEHRISPTEVRKEVTYRYRPSWSTSNADSWRFEVPSGHRNPQPVLPPGVLDSTAVDAKLSNGMAVPNELIDQLNDFVPVPLGHAPIPQPAHLPPALLVRGGAVYLPHVDAELRGLGEDGEPRASQGQNRASMARMPVSLAGSAPLRTAADVARADAAAEPSKWLAASGSERDEGLEGRPLLPLVPQPPPPAVGDIRVRWEAVDSPAEGVSILAMQRGVQATRRADVPVVESGALTTPVGLRRASLAPWGDGSGHTVFRLVRGLVSAEEMVRQLRAEERRRRWLLRTVGWAGMAVGFKLILRTIDAIASLVPFGIGSILASLTSTIGTFVALGSSAGVSTLVIAIAWLRFRPVAAALVAAAAAATSLAPILLARAHANTPLPRPR